MKSYENSSTIDYIIYEFNLNFRLVHHHPETVIVEYKTIMQLLLKQARGMTII